MKSIKFLVLLSFFIISNIAINTVNASNNQDAQEFCHVKTKLINNQSEFLEIQPAYVSAFVHAYRNHPARSLNMIDKEQFLITYLSEDEHDLNKPGFYPLKVIDQHQKLIAYISLDDIDNIRLNDKSRAIEFATLPSGSVYIRNLFVNLDSARQGIGTFMLNKVISNAIPNAQHLYVATRRINDPAIQLYKKCGFTECPVNLHNLSELQYISLEKHLKK